MRSTLAKVSSCIVGKVYAKVTDEVTLRHLATGHIPERADRQSANESTFEAASKKCGQELGLRK